MVSIKSVLKNGIFIPEKEDGQDVILCLQDTYFTHAYDEFYFFSEHYDKKAFLLREANKTWFTSYEKALKKLEESK